YVVLDGLGPDYDEEFLIINEEGAEGDLLAEQQQHLDGCEGLLVPGPQAYQQACAEAGEQLMVANDMQLAELEELVEEDQDQEQDLDLDEFNLDYAGQMPEDDEEDDIELDPEQEQEAQLLAQALVPSIPPAPPKLAPVPQISVRCLADDEGGDLKRQSKPSEKMLDEFKGPRRYLLFDDLVATIVDFDEDNTPIVEFSTMNHQDEKLPVECGICPDVMHKSKLSKHHKTHMVPETNRYACIYCAETYRDCKYLAGHARRHMGIRPYVCEICKLYFSTKQDLRVHNQRRHLEKEHICEMCGKTFAQNTQLKRHRETTHEKKRRHQCQYCQKAYYKNFSLQEHIRNVHMGKRRMLKCPFCGMQCRDAHKMARHRKEMHLSQTSFVCHLCHEEFTDINYFDAHKRSIQCRSNTRRLVGEGEAEGEGEGECEGEDEDYDYDAEQLADPMQDRDSLPGPLLQQNDEDSASGMRLLTEADLEEEEEYRVEDAGLLVEDGQGQHYLTTVDGEQQYVQLSDYDHQRLLDEETGLPVDEDLLECEGEMLTEEQYIRALEEQQLQMHRGQSHFSDELIYEITLKTETD
ncbi:hypothetical protein KR018_011968, partial [Drosophila ironensis]